MWAFLTRHLFLVSVAIIAILIGIVGTWRYVATDPLANLVTATAEPGTVEMIVSVSGITESTKTAELAFPATGRVIAVPAREGDVVAAGTVLATLGSQQELATLEQAQAALSAADANRAKLIAGLRTEARAVTDTEVAAARMDVERATDRSELAVENARRALYSNDLTARTPNPEEDAPAPTISGTYTCDEAGEYTMRIYSSGAPSGYSMALDGLETGIYVVSSEQAVPFGTCGLMAKFATANSYHNSNWVIAIPNTSSASYLTYEQALTTATKEASIEVAVATDTYTLKERQRALENATPENADLAQANAAVLEAKAAVARAEATLADRSIIAPFAGVVSRVDVTAGETAVNGPVITLLSTDAFDLIARIPEIDITKVEVGQSARVRFDANQNSELPATITFIAPVPTIVDGVSYFEITLSLNEQPAWLRGGLNADIDIITDSRSDTVRIPSRYLIDTNGILSVRTLNGTTLGTTTVSVLFRGNDGYVSVSGLTSGTTIVAP